MLISTALLLDSIIRNSVCTPAKLPCRRVEVGYINKSMTKSCILQKLAYGNFVSPTICRYVHLMLRSYAVLDYHNSQPSSQIYVDTCFIVKLRVSVLNLLSVLSVLPLEVMLVL
jgi:hypothetical protein